MNIYETIGTFYVVLCVALMTVELVFLAGRGAMQIWHDAKLGKENRIDEKIVEDAAKTLTEKWRNN